MKSRSGCIFRDGMCDPQHVGPGIAAGIRQIDRLERLVEGLAQKVFVKRDRVVSDEDGRRPVRELRVHLSHRLVV